MVTDNQKGQNAPVAVGGVLLKHEGAKGIVGLLGMLAQVLEDETWPVADFDVRIRARRDPMTGYTDFETFNVLNVENEDLPEYTEVEE